MISIGIYDMYQELTEPPGCSMHSWHVLASIGTLEFDKVLAIAKTSSNPVQNTRRTTSMAPAAILYLNEACYGSR